MNRRDFLKLMPAGAIAVAAAPIVASHPVEAAPVVVAKFNVQVPNDLQNVIADSIKRVKASAHTKQAQFPYDGSIYGTLNVNSPVHIISGGSVNDWNIDYSPGRSIANRYNLPPATREPNDQRGELYRRGAPMMTDYEEANDGW